MAGSIPWNEGRDDGDDGGQRQLADLLVATLGRDGAINACRGNAWYGVLQLILDIKDESTRG